ncbi:hypothetical protein AB0J27_16685 [Micromonospora chokoriensis]
MPRGRARGSEPSRPARAVVGSAHPGDSLFVPPTPVATLLVPAAAPWLKLREALDFVRAVRPNRAFPIHDATLNELGQEYFDDWLDFKGGTEYAHPGRGVGLSPLRACR